MNQVTSKDGTSIVYDCQGSGLAVVLIGGGLDDGSENAPLVAELADGFTVFNYARRGRGDSGDTQPYAVDREIEDLAAIIVKAGGSAHVYGVSSGGMFALEAAMSGVAIDRIALYEVPYDTAEDAPQRYREYAERLGAALAEGRRGDAVEFFMRLAGSSEDDIAGARNSTYWPGLEALAYTLAYDAACYGPPPTDRLAKVTPPTLVLTGDEADFFGPAADAIVASIPHARRLIVQGQGHMVDPKAIAPVLKEFFSE
jgi:pimeloyl-ACP methyl ester carboxylesterase